MGTCKCNRFRRVSLGDTTYFRVDVEARFDGSNGVVFHLESDKPGIPELVSVRSRDGSSFMVMVLYTNYDDQEITIDKTAHLLQSLEPDTEEPVSRTFLACNARNENMPCDGSNFMHSHNNYHDALGMK